MAALAPTADTSTAVVKITYAPGDEEFISRTEFEQARDKLLQGASEQQVLEYITSRHLLLHEARTANISATPTEVDEFVERLRTETCTQVPIPEAQSTTDPAALLDACAKFFGSENASGLRRYLQEEITVNKHIEKNATAGEELHAAHILVETEDEARKVRERVTTGGEDFSTVAKEVSTEPAAKESGGDLGFFGPGQMVAPFETAAFALKDGEISQPVQTDFGWHIIKVIERRPGQISSQSAGQYRDTVLQTAQQEGKVQYLITPAPPPTMEAPMELPTADISEEAPADATAQPEDATATLEEVTPEATAAAADEDATATSTP
jgi:parvulin-like peptidyl-prolyl isomerase